MKKDLTVSSTILFFAFRYALGRSSYAPSIVMDGIKANIEDVSTPDIEAYIREIGECTSYGMDIDKAEWLTFQAFLQNVLTNRQKG